MRPYRLFRRRWRRLVTLLAGALVSCLLTELLKAVLVCYPTPTGVGRAAPGTSTEDNGSLESYKHHLHRHHTMFVGIMTAKKNLNTRVVSAYATWAQQVPGRVVFFSSEGSEIAGRPDIPLVSLPGVDDTYPPQRKAFTMLKYMHDHYVSDYEWFVRADDDVFIKDEYLKVSFKGRHFLFIGQL